MSRYTKILDNKIVKFGLPLLAGYLLITEGFLWRKKIANSTPPLTDSVEQQQPIVSSPVGTQTARAGSDPFLSASTAQLPNLARKATFEQVGNVPAGVFEYGGSTTWAPIRKDIDSDILALHPGFRLQYTAPAADSGRTAGSGTGIQMVLNDELIFSQASRPLKEAEKEEAWRQGYNLQQVAVAIDGIAIAVNPDLDISGLTMAQLQGIYTGEIKSWADVGGPDIPVEPHSRRVTDSGTTEFFGEAVLQGAPISPDVQFVESTTAGIRRVASQLGGIYYASATELVGQCAIRPLPVAGDTGSLVPPYVSPYVKSSECPRYRNQINATQFQNGDYPITRELFIIVKQNGQVEEEVGVAYANFLLTDEGQRLIEQTGFVKTGRK